MGEDRRKSEEDMRHERENNTNYMNEMSPILKYTAYLMIYDSPFSSLSCDSGRKHFNY